MAVLSEKFLSFFRRVTHCVALSMLLASCGIKSEISTTTAGASLAGVTVSKIRPIEAKPSDLLTIEGSNFSASKDLRARVSLEDGSTKDVPLKVIDRTKGTFVMPEGAGLGLKSVSIFQGGSKQVASLGIVANTAENQLPILITEQSAVCSDTQYIDRNGDTQTGTKDCSAQSVKSCAVDGDSNCLVDGNTYKAAAINNLSAGNIKFGVTIAGVSGNVTLPANCSEDGITGCVTTSSFKSADMTSAIAGNIKTGATIAGVPGSVTSESHSSCASDGAIGCVTVAGFKSADMSVAIAGNIKSGITIAGQLGDYPSVTYKLPRAEGATADLADLDNATFDIKVKSATAFEYWTSTGSYQTGAGDADITQANIKDTVSIFGTVGNLTAAVAPNSWDVRVGVTVNGVTGKLKVNCRNRVGSAFNYDGAISGIGQSPVTSGTAIDIWDTIDDYNNNVSGLPPSIVTAWGSNTDCGGIDTPGLSSDDDNVWKDVTTTNGTTASTCAATSANCTMQDKITGLWWSKQQTGAAWNTAWSTCLTTLNGTTYGTNSVPGYNGQTGWRLPTQKELMDAYNHGIRSAADKPPINNWITEASIAANYFWSGSSVSSATSSLATRGSCSWPMAARAPASSSTRTRSFASVEFEPAPAS
jgi:hypothetical protein